MSYMTGVNIASATVNPRHRAYELYVAGCTRGCPGCHNPELHPFTPRGAREWAVWWRRHSHEFREPSPLFDKIWILGGDLLCQEAWAVSDMLRTLKETGLPLWLWTGAEREEVERKAAEYGLDAFAFIKTGPYQQDLPGVIQCWSDGREDEGHFRLASDNQRLWRVIPGSGGRYLGLEPAGPALPVEAEAEAAETEAW